jgi:triosephosphate isomerase
MRRPIIAGNWKMHKTCSEAVALAVELIPLSEECSHVDVVICPPFTALYPVSQAIVGAWMGLGAQDVFWKAEGAYTSQISAGMLLDVGVRYAIVGHSEARGRFGVPEPDFDAEILRHFGDTDRSVNRKASAALAAGLMPIICVGETLAEREAGTTDAVVSQQTSAALEGFSAEQMDRVIFAYEPVWAIGTGRVCDTQEADRVCGVVRGTVAGLLGSHAGLSVRIQYGGSVKPDNAADLLAQPNIDGALVGGASLRASDFGAVVRAAPKG